MDVSLELKNKCRLYVPVPFHKRNPVSLSKPQTHYLRQVLRYGEGQSVRIFNGFQGEWIGSIAWPSRGAAYVIPVTQILSKVEPQTSIFLFFAPIKPHRLSFLLEKVTEVGVDYLVPCVTEHTDVPKRNLERYSSTLIEAAEQSHRLTVPTLQPLRTLEEQLRNWQTQDTLFVCDICPDTPSFEAALMSYSGYAPARVGIAVGPEGGWSAQERNFLRTLPFAMPVNLGSTVLRAETAAVVAVAATRGRLI